MRAEENRGQGAQKLGQSYGIFVPSIINDRASERVPKGKPQQFYPRNPIGHDDISSLRTPRQTLLLASPKSSKWGYR